MTTDVRTARRWGLLSVTAGCALTLAVHLSGDEGAAFG